MGLSSAGIGSGLDVEGLVSKLMSAEAAPLSNYDKKTALLQSRLAALGKLGGAIGAFQGSLSALSSAATFSALKAAAGDDTLLSASATSDAVPGKYSVNVTQLAQAQRLSTAGKASMTALLGGATTTLNFQFGTVSGGQFGVAGGTLGASVATGGIASGSLTINGSAIATDGTTRSAKLLADAINARSAATGVSATAAKTATGATLFGSGGSTSFGDVATDATSSYALSVGGVQIAAQGVGVAAGAGVTAASIDSALAGSSVGGALSAANITFTGTAAAGTLQFFAADGSNISVTEAVSSTVAGGVTSGGIGHAPGIANAGSTVTATSSVSLTSASGSAISIGGATPALAGFSAGSGGTYLGAGFAQDGALASGSVTLNPADQSLQGIRDAINKANIGVSASIVSDGSASPYHLVLTSTKTGANAAMKISLAGDGTNPADPAMAALLGYDPAGAQALIQTSAAQSTLANVNGIAVSSNSTSISGAIQGVTLDVSKTGATTVDVTRDTKSVSDGVSAFVKAYNDLNKSISSLTSYNADSKSAGPLQGNSTVRSIQSQLRRQMGTAVAGLSGNLTTLSQIGIAFQKDGSLALDSTKLNKAISDNFADIGGLFAAIGSATDGMVKFSGSGAATKPGSYDLEIGALATRGALTSAAAVPASTVIAANTTWSVTLNQTDPVSSSKVQSIAIPAGTYSPSELAAMLRATINGNATFAGAGDAVETAIDANGNLALSSSKYGSTSNIALASQTGTAPADLFGAAVPAVGTDVTGTIGGAAATGSGQTLTAPDSSPAAGMKLLVTGGAIGSRGTVSFSQGYAYQLNNLAASFIGTSGLITGQSDGLNVSIKSVARDRDAFSNKLGDIEKRYRAQFTALDTALSSMQSTSNYLTQQLAALAKNS